MSSIGTITTVFVILALITTLYSFFLQSIQERYVPDYVWVTVVAGNSFIIGAVLVIALLEPGLSALSMAGVIIGANIAAGTPVIVWQLWQMGKRWKQRHEREKGNATEEARRS